MGSKAGMSASDVALVAMAGGADAIEAMETLFRLCNRDLYRWVMSYTHDHHNAQDVVGETWLRVATCLRAGKYPPDAPFEPWIRGVARRVLYQLWRTQGKRGEVQLFDDWQIDGALLRAGLCEEAADAALMRTVATQRLAAALMALVGAFPAYGEAVTMCYVHGLSASTAAEVVGTTDVNIRQRCRRGLTKLRSYLADDVERTTVLGRGASSGAQGSAGAA